MLTNYSGQGLFPFDVYENKLSLYDLLGLKDPKKYIETYNPTHPKIPKPSGVWKNGELIPYNGIRQTGRTTNLIIEAIHQGLNHRQVLICSPNYCIENYIQMKTERLLRKLGNVKRKKIYFSILSSHQSFAQKMLTHIGYPFLLLDHTVVEQISDLITEEHIPSSPSTHWSYLRVQHMQESGKWTYSYE